MEYIVLFGLVIACLLASCPTNLCPSFVNPTIDGVVRVPSTFCITFGDPPYIIATQLLPVPKSIPQTILRFVVICYYSVFSLIYIQQAIRISIGDHLL